ncbi:MAG: sigma-54-dependent Fis family transcriptional regulator [Chromatiales bacterium]|nr:sigma-54-dependent Fis family transcriptional regulator [Chromatiales bacterium]
MNLQVAANPSGPVAPILLVDDEPALLKGLALTLRSAGFERVDTIEDSRLVVARLEAAPVAAVVLDLTMPYLDGETLLRRIVERHPEVPVVIVTATNDVDTAVRCIRAGAVDYLVKPVEPDRLIAAVARTLELRELRGEVERLRSSLLEEREARPAAFAPILTRDPVLDRLLRYVEAIAPSAQPVLITGETGVGKELIARAVHELSGRAGPLVSVNVAGIDDQVFGDTLFGHQRGAFTGADANRRGLIREAGEGTVFLDEIGDLGAASQVKLLRLLQDGQFYPLGADRPERSRARFVVATNRPLDDSGEQWMRRDLYFRLRTHRVHVPPLRERRDDLKLLVPAMLARAARELGRTVPVVPPEIFALLGAYEFPGNVRELESLLHDAVARHERGVLSLESLRAAIGGRADSELGEHPAAWGTQTPSTERLPTLREAEAALIEAALERAQHNQGVAASLLGISRQALNKRLSRRTPSSS